MMDKYPDYEKVEYYLIYSELIVAARKRGTVTYQELALVVGLPTSGNHMGKRIGEMLGAVSENEHNHGRPMLSAVTIRAEGRPGSGFFDLARTLGLLDGDERQAENTFWEVQKKQIYTMWQQKFPMA